MSSCMVHTLYTFTHAIFNIGKDTIPTVNKNKLVTNAEIDLKNQTEHYSMTSNKRECKHTQFVET